MVGERRDEALRGVSPALGRQHIGTDGAGQSGRSDLGRRRHRRRRPLRPLPGDHRLRVGPRHRYGPRLPPRRGGVEGAQPVRGPRHRMEQGGSEPPRARRLVLLPGPDLQPLHLPGVPGCLPP